MLQQWNTVNSIQQTDSLHYKGFAGKSFRLFSCQFLLSADTPPGAFASFFMTGDPNALKLTAEDVTGVPALRTEQEWVIDSQGFTTHNLTQFKQRCDFWRQVAPRLPV